MRRAGWYSQPKCGFGNAFAVPHCEDEQISVARSLKCTHSMRLAPNLPVNKNIHKFETALDVLRARTDASVETLHRDLVRLNEFRFRPGFPFANDVEALDMLQENRLRLTEAAFVERERAAVAWQVANVPEEPIAFVTWFETLKQTGPGQNDRLFPWLAETSTLEEMRWFLGQEVAGEAGFEDLLALTQIKMPAVAKLEMARNYWDEMGQGNQLGMHGPLLEKLATALDLHVPIDKTVWESLALSNLMAGLASNRRYAFHSVGALGVIELTAPTRAVFVNAGLKRLGVEPAARKYFALHATLDVQHSRAWNREVLLPLITMDPRLARPIAEGALMRLRAGERCFSRYRQALGLGAAYFSA